jgi:hypothetical protein
VLGQFEGEKILRASQPGVFLHSIPVASEVDQGRAMREAVEGGASHRIRGEHMAPVSEGVVTGQHYGRAVLRNAVYLKPIRRRRRL